MWFTAALPSVGAFILGCGSILLFVIAYQFLFAIRYPANLPLINEPPGKKSFGLKTGWRYYKDCKNIYLEAYKKVYHFHQVDEIVLTFFNIVQKAHS